MAIDITDPEYCTSKNNYPPVICSISFQLAHDILSRILNLQIRNFFMGNVLFSFQGDVKCFFCENKKLFS